MTKTIYPKDISQPDLHRYLLAAVAPRPICFASTIDAAGNVNLSPYSFFNVFSSNPPIMVFSPARSGKTNTLKHTHQNVLEVKEVVINIVNFPIVEQMSLSSTAYDKGVNEFVKSGLTQVPSTKVAPPRVGESPVSFECTVQQVIELGQEGGAGNLVIARVEMIHIQEAYLNEEGFLDTKKLDLVARMGDSWYCHANGDALFQIAKPLRTKGMGVDQLPKSVTNSHIFTGNDLGKLGNIEALPEADVLAKTRNQSDVSKILQQGLSSEVKVRSLHELAQGYLHKGEKVTALSIALIAESF